MLENKSVKSKVAILYICTGKYGIFFKDFFESSNKYLLKNHSKHYFVFTDDEKLKKEYKDFHSITFIHQDRLGWPYDTLKRFHMFSEIVDELKHFNYIYFINANTKILTEIGEEILPDNVDQIVACLHPGYFNTNRRKFPYETNKKSKAYISKNEGKNYFAGGVNGGTSKSYIKLISTLRENIDCDLSSNIIAKWHDESHINKYLSNANNIKIVDSGYLYPEGWSIPFEPKILVKDKSKHGGHSQLRNETTRSTSLIKSIWHWLKK